MQRTLVFRLKNFLANCKICDSPTCCLTIDDYYKILFESLISNLVAGANFAKRDICQVHQALSNAAFMYNSQFKVPLISLLHKHPYLSTYSNK